MPERSVEVLIPFRPGSDSDPDTGAVKDFRSPLFGWCERFWTARGFTVRSGDSPVEPFTRGHALNDLAESSDADVFVIADADTVVSSAVWVARTADLQGKWWICYERNAYYSLTESATARLLDSDPGEPLVRPTPGDLKAITPDAVSGVLVVPRLAFEAVRGFDRRFRGWGSEDWAFLAALDTLWGPHVRLPGFALALYHPHIEANRFEQPHFRANEALAQNYLGARHRPSDMRSLISQQEGIECP